MSQSSWIAPLLRPFVPQLTIAAQYVGSAASQMLVLGSQLVVFVLLARHLGETLFGHLMAITAATQIAFSLCGLGCDEPMVRRLVCDRRSYPDLLGHNLLLVAASGACLTLVATVALYLTQPMQRGDLALAIPVFAFTNIVLYRIITLTESIFIGRMEYMRANMVVVLFSALRVAAACIAVFVAKIDDLAAWSLWFAGAHVLGALGCAVALWPFGPPRWCVMPDELGRGIHVATPLFLNALRQNIDTLILSMAVAPAVLGNFSAATRIVQASLVTVWAFSRVMYPRLVAANIKGRAATFRLAYWQALTAVSIGGAVGLGLFIAAPDAAALFGAGFDRMAKFLQILCWIPVLAALQGVAFDALGAVERHGLRALIVNSTAVLGACLVAALTFSYGVPGTLVAIYLGQAIALSGVWLALLYLARQGVRPLVNAPSQPRPVL